MSFKSHIAINNESDISAFRRKIYDLAFQLTESGQIASTVASNVSEILKNLIQKLQTLNIEVAFDRNDNDKAIKLSFLCSAKIEGIADLLPRLGLQPNFSSGKKDLLRAEKRYVLSSISKNLPTDADLNSILEAKSRDELFAEIAEQQKSLQQILDNSPVSIGFRVGDTYKYVNSMYESHFGMRVGDTIKDIYAIPKQREMLQMQLAIEGSINNVEAVFKKKNGEHRTCLFTILPMEYKGENGYMVWISDVTEQKQAEEAILKAKNAAEEATKTKSDFLANMSHEIRTPMNAIIGMSHLALQGNMDRRERNYIEKVNRAGENLLGIINDILDFSKIEAGKMSMEKVDFDLDDLMDNLANLIGMKAEEKGVELLFNIKKDVPSFLIGDPLRLGQILINLGNNAVKFTEAGEIVITVEKVSEAANAIELHFSVQDSGIGMTPEQCGRMFQSFSQADTSTTRKYGGTGLGLAISKNLVELMDGRIWVESEAGKGSAFQFQVKLEKQNNQSPKQVVDVDKLAGLRVLVADDNPTAREVLVSLVESLGTQVDVACDGLQALEAIEKSKGGKAVDIVLMDWQMPKMDGLQAAQKIIEMRNPPQIIMVTSFARGDVLDELQKQNINLDNVLTKPVTKAGLIAAMGGALHQNIADKHYDRKTNEDDHMEKLRNKNVLLVEDNKLNQELAFELLSQAGMQVTVANHGQEALDILKANPTGFDCVLMDCQMPVMDGYTATRELRKLPEFADLPIVAMTANAMIGDKEKVLDAGMWDHISKPLNVKTMFVTIAKHIKHTESATNSSESLSVPTQQSKKDSALPNLIGIDVKKGLANTLDNEGLYRRLLGMFYDSQKDFSNAFLQAQKDPDQDAAMRCAHTLKGNAGNIGALGVQLAADKLEEACKNKLSPPEINDLLSDVLKELNPVIDSLSLIEVKKEKAVSQLPVNSDEEIRQKINTLRTLLEDSDEKAVDCLNDILDRVNGGALARELKTLQRHIENYDFDVALESLRRLQI